MHAAKSPAGYWQASSPIFNDKVLGIVKIKISNQRLCGRLVKVIPLNGSFGGGIAASGPIVMCDYREQNGMWIGGRMYEQSTAKIYPSTLSISNDGNYLYVRGYSGAFSQTAIWRRIK